MLDCMWKILIFKLHIVHALCNMTEWCKYRALNINNGYSSYQHIVGNVCVRSCMCACV